MNAYEELLQVMRKEGKKENPASIQLGIMTSATSCKIGKLTLSESDLLIAEHLKTGYQSENAFIEPLKSGDKVAIYRMSDELYLILERLV